MQADLAGILARVFQAVHQGDLNTAGDILEVECPFVPIKSETRHFTETQSLRVFMRDGFIDRHSARRLVFPGIFRLLTRLLPRQFPYSQNWKMSETHPAYWELFPTIDHVLPVARGGQDIEENMVTTSMLRNAAESNWTLAELGWST